MWAHTAKSPKVGPASAAVIGFAGIWLVHMSWLTFKIAIVGIIVFVVLAWLRISLGNAFGWILYKISGAGLQIYQSQRRFIRRARL